MAVTRTFYGSKTRGHAPPAASTVVIRQELHKLIAAGKRLFTSQDLRDMAAFAGERAVAARKAATETLKHFYKWKNFRYHTNEFVFYDPTLPEEALAPYRVVATPKELETRKRLGEIDKDRTRFSHLSRAEQKEELLKGATKRRTPMDEYIFRAAKVCGVVRGYKWPQ